FVLFKPPVGLNTGKVYSQFDTSAVECPHHAWQLVQALTNGNIEEIGSLLFNSLEKPAFELMPKLEEYKRAMQLPGVVSVLMTGSGSCLFALCQNAQAAKSVASTLRKRFPEYFVLATASKVQ
ncbi:MAG: hypothetical protein Q4G59_06495, partial [Planctomycetia bacterium]|nr:hypothetical protein [Planctomycetia bacterium]